MNKIYLLYNPVNQKWLSKIKDNTFYWTKHKTKAMLFEDEYYAKVIASLNLLDIQEIQYE